MNDNIIVLKYQEKEIILVGTSHVLKESAELVKKVVSEENPDSVCVELDEARYQGIQNPKAWENTDIVQVIKTKKVGFLLANLVLSSYQKKIAQKLNTTVGQEILQGMESAKEIKAELILADRSIQTTFLRIWRKLSFWEKGKLLLGVLFSDEENDNNQISDGAIKKIMEEDIIEAAMSDMHKQFPKIGEILISERDQHLASKIKNAPGKKIVAILGAAHLKGVKEEIFKSQDMESITEIPPKSPISNIVGWAIPVCIIGLVSYGFITNIQTGLHQLSSWILWNGVLASLFTAISLGHPLSIITAFIASPITSLNPFMACGWFAGLTEATIRKPTVQDVINIPTDIFSIKGFYKNRFLRTMLIVIMANIGSSIGTMIAGIDIVKNLL
ncbi:TraB/GumN family protein [Clostridium sp.]|uniref:TraB/GumN family protein n=1 Tax=Clostridium sp. TaxID=1506 RepID=UPI003EEF437B